MSRILNVAGMAAVGMTAASMLLLAEPGFASDLAADANIPAIILPGADALAAGVLTRQASRQPPAVVAMGTRT